MSVRTDYDNTFRVRAADSSALESAAKFGGLSPFIFLTSIFAISPPIFAGCKNLDYWERLKSLKLLSLQQRRERYCIIQVWKMLHGLAPNTIKMTFYEQNRLGMKVTLPPVNNKAQISVRTDYENSFRIKASRLWNMLPKHVNTADSLDAFKRVLGDYLKKIPDTPPVPGYTAANRNSLLDWKNEMGGRT